MINDTQDGSAVSIKDVICEMVEEVTSKGARNLKAQIREMIDEIEYLAKKGYTNKHIVDKLAAHGIEITTRQLSQALYQVRQEIKRDEEKDLNGVKKRKQVVKEVPAPAPAPTVASAPATTASKQQPLVRPLATISQPSVFVRTKLTAEMRNEMRQPSK